MFLTTILVGLCLRVAGTPFLPSQLTVRVHVTFDRSLTSALQTVSEREAEAIWKVYGVDLRWTDAGAGPALCLDAIVERHENLRSDGAPVLGHVGIAPAEYAPIHISFDAIVSFARLLPRDHAVGIALGRVLAHEIGHVLLGVPEYHDAVGLMRASFLADDLVRPDRTRFLLTTRSVDRLRARIASWSDAPVDGCTSSDR